MKTGTNAEAEHSIAEVFADAEDTAGKIVRSPWVRTLSGCGFYAKGIVFLVIGTSAIFLAAGMKGGRIVDPAGALGAVAQLSLGVPLLLFLALGSTGHGLWNILRGVGDVDDLGKGVFGIMARSLAVCIGIFYLNLAFYALGIAVAGTKTTSGTEMQRSITSILISVPLGILIVLFLGLGFLGAAIHEFYSGIRGKYQENYRLWQISRRGRILVTFFGIVSFASRSIIYILISYFFLAAVFLLDPAQVRGIDGALLALAQTKYGGILLFIAGFGLACHGILAFFEAKYRRIC